MSSAVFPLKRPIGRALIVAGASARAQPLAAMQAQGYDCAEVDDPYAAAAELLRRPLVYRAVVLSLTSLFREELPIVATIKRRLPHVEIWLTHIDARQAALAEAMRLGADGLLGEDGMLHRTAAAGETGKPAPEPHVPPAPSDIPTPASEGEPVLSAEELKALLQEQPGMPSDENT